MIIWTRRYAHCVTVLLEDGTGAVACRWPSVVGSSLTSRPSGRLVARTQIRLVPPPDLALEWHTWTELDGALAAVPEGSPNGNKAAAGLRRVTVAKAQFVAARWRELAKRALDGSAASASVLPPTAVVASPRPGQLADVLVRVTAHELLTLTHVQRQRIERAGLLSPAPVPDVDESWSDDHFLEVQAAHRAEMRRRTDELNRDILTLPGKLDHATVACFRVPL